MTTLTGHQLPLVANEPVTGSAGEQAMILGLLNSSLATELVGMLRYRSHYFAARHIKVKLVADEFLAHAAEELVHADALAERISELGGEPDFAPSGLALRSYADYMPGHAILEMIQANIVAEHIEIERYRDLIHHIGTTDPVTLCLLENIVADERERLQELTELLAEVPAGFGGMRADGLLAAPVLR